MLVLSTSNSNYSFLILWMCYIVSSEKWLLRQDSTIILLILITVCFIMCCFCKDNLKIANQTQVNSSAGRCFKHTGLSWQTLLTFLVVFCSLQREQYSMFFTQILPTGAVNSVQSPVRRTSAIISLHTVGEIIPVKSGPRAAPRKKQRKNKAVWTKL